MCSIGSRWGIRVLDLAADKDYLFHIVNFRHDCVHRSGCDKDGNELMVITNTFVRQAAVEIGGLSRRSKARSGLAPDAGIAVPSDGLRRRAICVDGILHPLR
jgi:hypothetical protein